jgi:hypothetical protein
MATISAAPHAVERDLSIGVPLMSIDFGPAQGEHLRLFANVSDRQLFHELLHVDERTYVLTKAFDIASSRLAQLEEREAELPDLVRFLEPTQLHTSLAALRAESIRQRDELLGSVAALAKHQCAHLLRQFAPTALVDGCWLQNASAARSSHTAFTSSLLTLYAHEIGDGYASQHHGNTFRDMIQSLGIYLPEVGSIAFVEQAEILDAAFQNPVFLLSVSQFPRTFAPELVGLTLFYYVWGIGPHYLAMRRSLEEFGVGTRFLDAHELEASFEALTGTAIKAVEHCLELGAGTTGGVETVWRRIKRGVAAGYLATLDDKERALRFVNSAPVSPHERMVALINRKARHAHGYHAANSLAGKSLDDWMDPGQMDVEEFLQSFARSRYVSPGNAKDSLLLKKLVAFRGPMFRVFSPEELDVLTDWINSLPRVPVSQQPADSGLTRQAPQRSPARATEPVFRVKPSDKKQEFESIRRYARLPLGEIYYYLLNIEHFPDVRPFAKYFATRWMRRAGRGLSRGKRPIPFEPYQHQALDLWLDQQHARQVASYSRTTGEPAQSREQLIESTIQQTPMILIDGAWVQNSAKAGTSHTLVGSKLFHIFYDEVGNGDINLNHPNVYRELLAQMEVTLPEFGTIEFGRWEGFRPESFQVPVFWLSISQFPKRFLPETLGLNLAMELSGVGGAYRTAIDALRFYGFDPCFIELHNTIDNVSTGHTAWAIEAIKCHMDEMFDRGGSELVEKHWHRIWTGYRSLAPPPSGFFDWLSGVSS